MTIAELHGKLSPEHPETCTDRLEDLLTSDVFGTMRYAGWSYGFLDWLLSAEPAPLKPQPQRPLTEILAPSSVRAIHFAFWPMLPNRREPDVALLVHRDEDALLIVVEAKFLSGTSDLAVDDVSDELGRTGNQLADQMNALSTLKPEELAAWFNLASVPSIAARAHLFITASTLLPTSDYDAARRNLRSATLAAIDSYWLSWTSLYQRLTSRTPDPAVDTGRAALIADLLRLLEVKDLVPFSGFSKDRYRPSVAEARFWTDAWWSISPPQLGAPGFWVGSTA